MNLAAVFPRQNDVPEDVLRVLNLPPEQSAPLRLPMLRHARSRDDAPVSWIVMISYSDGATIIDLSYSDGATIDQFTGSHHPPPAQTCIEKWNGKRSLLRSRVKWSRPTKAKLSRFVGRSPGQFVYPTVIATITPKGRQTPKNKLKDLLKHQPGSLVNPLSELDSQSKNDSSWFTLDASTSQTLLRLDIFKHLQYPRPLNQRESPSNPLWTTVDGYWPQRLLHIPTMTSIERTGEDTYSGAQKPKYGTLTYTWGRWKRTKEDGPGPALEIKGTPWETPSVKEEHFTVEAFRKVIQRMGREVDWAWIDIACVEQRDGDADAKTTKMNEIGKQAGIFKNATCTFVWLSSIPTRRLEEHISKLVPWSQESFFSDHSKADGLQWRECDLAHVLRDMAREISAILDDPWFSSLWTLQEVILRQDAIVITQDGDTIRYDPDSESIFDLPISLLDIAHLARIYARLHQNIHHVRYELHISDTIRNITSKIIEDIERAGFPFFSSDNPNVQYGVARHRHTKRPLDRIYGIMQIYGLQVGEVIKPRRGLTLDKLQDEFAGAICAKCPILGQRFVHLERPPPGKAWRISQHSTVPNEIWIYRDPKPSCTIHLATSDGHARFKGKRCSLFTFNKVRLEYIAQNKEESFLHFWAIVDGYLLKHLNLSMPTGISSSTTRQDLFTDIARELCEKYGKWKLHILELGTLESRSCFYNKGKTYMPEVPRERFGIIVRQKPMNGELAYSRVGICVWDDLKPFREAGAGEKFDESLGWRECDARLL